MKAKSIIAAALLAVATGCNKAPQVPAQRVGAEIIAVYQTANGELNTSLKLEDGTRVIWDGHKLGSPGDKFSIWKRGATTWLQDPN